MLADTFRRYEAFLRIDREGGRWDLVRSRGVYLYAWLFAALQLANLVGMTISYGAWTVDHTASVLAAVLLLSISVGLRWTKNFALFAGAYGAVLLCALLLVSLRPGINSAMLPAIVVGPMMAAFVCGWRSAVIIGAGCLAILGWQFSISIGELGQGGPWTLVQVQQRFFQAVFAVITCTVMSALLSASCERAFRKMEAAIVEANRAARAKTDFLATMSHELRTPMNGVLGLTEALLSEGPGPLQERQSTLLSTIRGSGEHLLALLNDLLDLSKIEAGKIKLDPRAFHLRSLLRAVKDTYIETAVGKGISLDVLIADDLPEWVFGDDQRVRQILNNLVSNGIKFTETGGVTLDVARGAADDIIFTVTDTGKGIPDEAGAIIFKPFEQGDRGTTRRYGGTGLGLSICRRLSIVMGGSIELKTSEPGKTVFVATVPLPATRKPKRKAKASGLTAGGFENLRVLVAEDNGVNRLVLGEFLAAWGAKAVFAEDGIEALSLFDQTEFDILLVDRQMPGLDGEGVVANVRARGGAKGAIPIVAVTADAMESDRAAMLGIGVDGFVSKPLKPEALKNEMAAVLHGAQSEKRRAGDLAG